VERAEPGAATRACRIVIIRLIHQSIDYRAVPRFSTTGPTLRTFTDATRSEPVRARDGEAVDVNLENPDEGAGSRA
jgi:hypothetical protein